MLSACNRGSLVVQLGADELAVQARDVGDGLVLGAHGFAGTGVGACLLYTSDAADEL